MASLSEIRRKNLLQLRKSAQAKFLEDSGYEGKRYTDIIFCKQIGISPSAYSQLKNPKQKPHFNEMYARKIEKRLNLTLGWFDIDHQSNDVSGMRINFVQFEKAVLAYYDFLSADIISINNEEKRRHLLSKLFKFVHTHADIEQVDITEDDFFEMMKK